MSKFIKFMALIQSTTEDYAIESDFYLDIHEVDLFFPHHSDSNITIIGLKSGRQIHIIMPIIKFQDIRKCH
jgi:hypothetical protein